MIRATLAALVKAAGLWPGLSWVDSELRDVFMLPASGDDVESRRHAGLNQENRSRAGMRPISARKWTDLDGGGAGRLTWVGSIRPAIPARR